MFGSIGALVVGLFVLVIIGAIIAAIAGGGNSTKVVDASPSQSQVEAAAPEEPVVEAPAGTVSQQNAVRTAEDYLDYSSFSRIGLIDQLEYEGFTTADATYAVDTIVVDWNEQAALSAKEYLDYSSFSRQGLIDQLLYEEFTNEQAVYGVGTTGL